MTSRWSMIGSGSIGGYDMTEAEKAIARAQTILQKKQGDLIDKLREAEINYNDTGYERYYNQKERIEAQIDQLDTYIKAQRYLKEADKEAKGYKDLIRDHETFLRDYMERLPKGSAERDAVDHCLSDLGSRKALRRM